MVTIIQQKKKDYSRTHQKLEHGDICFTSVTISMPLTLKTKIDSLCSKDGRSKYLCTILKQYFAEQSESDPRYLLSQKELELDNLEKEYKLAKLTLTNQIELLKEEAEKKYQELVKK